MDIKHERVEMHASLVEIVCGECVIEGIHKHSLSCPDITVEMEGLLMEGDHTEPGHHEELAVSG